MTRRWSGPRRRYSSLAVERRACAAAAAQRHSVMRHLEHPWYLAFGLLFVAIAIFGALSGNALARGFSVSRKREPIWFWMIIVMQCSVGIFICRKAFVPN